MSDHSSSTVEPARRPLGVTILAAWICVGAALRMLAVLFVFLGRRVPTLDSPFLVGLEESLVAATTVPGLLFTLAGAGLHAAMGMGLWRLRNWARILAVFLYLTMLPFLIRDLIAPAQIWHLSTWILLICKTLIYIGIIWYLFRPRVKQLFKASRDRLAGSA